MKIKAIAMVMVMLAPVGAQACYLKGQYTEGMNRICLYDCLNGTRAITVGVTSLCPLSLYRDLRASMGLEPTDEPTCTN